MYIVLTLMNVCYIVLNPICLTYIVLSITFVCYIYGTNSHIFMSYIQHQILHMS